MAFYEHVLIMRPDISPQQVETLIEEISKFITDNDGKIGKTEYWGLRNLAYPINKARKGHYSLLNLDVPPTLINTLNTNHRISDDIIRSMTIKVDALDDTPSPVIARRSDRDDKRNSHSKLGD